MNRRASDESDQTPTEQRLILDIKQYFGDALAQLFLAGFGDDELVTARSFLVEPEELNIYCSLNISTEDPEGLPKGQEPLVLLALVKILKEDLTGIGTMIPSPVSHLRGILGWEDSDESHRIIHRAIRKYFNLSYVTIIKLSQSLDEAAAYTIVMRRLMVSCVYRAGKEGISDPEAKICQYIEFNKEMREELMEGELFGLKWAGVGIKEYSNLKI